MPKHDNQGGEGNASAKLQFLKVVHLEFNPKEDITTYELAQCIPYILNGRTDELRVFNIPENVIRHFDKY